MYLTLNLNYKKKFLLLFALLLGISSAVSAFTVKDICKSYNYSGEVYQIYTTIPDLKEEDVDGWPMSKMSGTVTIEPLAGDTVVVKVFSRVLTILKHCSMQKITLLHSM